MCAASVHAASLAPAVSTVTVLAPKSSPVLLPLHSLWRAVVDDVAVSALFPLEHKLR